MKDKKIIIDNVYIVIICLCIIFSSLFIGSPINRNSGILLAIINTSAVIYIILNMFFNKDNKIKFNILLIITFIMLISSALPLIFNTYVSLSGTIYNILDVFGIVSLIILIFYNENRNKKKYIINSILISGIILCVISIDNLTTNVFTNFLEKIGNGRFFSADGRQISSLGYPNSFAVYIGLCFILSIGRLIETKKSLNKSIYSSILVLFLSLILLSYSRGTYVFLGIILLIYIFTINENKNKINLFLTSISTFILSICFMKIYVSLMATKQFLLIYPSIIILCLINAIMQIIISKISTKLEKVDMKKVLIVLAILLLCGIGLFFFLFRFTKPLELFSRGKSETEYIQTIDYITSENGFDVEIELEAKSKTEEGMQYGIVIAEKSIYNDTLKEHYIELNNFKGKKKIKIEKQKDVKYLEIKYQNYSIKNSGGLTIYSLKINGKNAILDYKYLPKEIVYKVKTIFNNPFSVTERFTFYKDGLKVASNHPILGQGGDAWKYLEQSVQEYKYYASEVHSYPIEVFIDNGILGLISVITLYLLAFYLFFKQMKNNQVNYLILGILLVLGHSIIDFDMSFMVIQLALFSIFALCMNCMEMQIRRNKVNIIIRSILLITLVLGCIFNILRGVSEQIYWININKSNNQIEQAKEIYKIYPWNNNVLIYILNNTNNTEENEKYVYYAIKYEPFLEQNLIIEKALDNNMPEGIIMKLIYKSINSKPKDLENMLECYNILDKYENNIKNPEKINKLKEKIKHDILENLNKIEYRVDINLKDKYIKNLN